MQRVFCHSLGVTSEGKYSFEGLPPEKFEVYAKRAFVMAEKDDLVVIPPHEETKEVREEIVVLNEVGLGPDPRNIVYGRSTSEGKLILPDGKWKGSSRSIPGGIIPFTGKTALPFALAKEMEMKVMAADESKVKSVDGKDFFQSLGMECIPEGGILRNEQEVLDFFSGLNGGKWISKTSQNASGMSTCLISPEKRNKEAILSFVEEGKLPVIQKYYRHNISPSVNMDVGSKGRISDLFLSGQILSRSPEGGLIHEGNIYPYELPLAVKRYLMSNSVRIAREYSRAGYFGPLGVDWIGDLGGGTPPKAVEVNARVTAPRYPYKVMKKLGSHSFCLQNMEFTPGMTPFQVREALDPIWFDRERKSGVIFFNFNRGMGKMAVISLGQTSKESRELMDQAEALL